GEDRADVIAKSRLREGSSAGRGVRGVGVVDPRLGLGEAGLQRLPQAADGQDQHDCDQRDHQAVLDHRRAFLFSNKTLEHDTTLSGGESSRTKMTWGTHVPTRIVNPLYTTTLRPAPTGRGQRSTLSF